ncbi:hypothetical protein L218DRAFT_939013 [Marasmius fiardii PR-910]|nr:hypothetical protein L218DRAFT_939013 [Marasmius fiardii PR-910]
MLSNKFILAAIASTAVPSLAARSGPGLASCKWCLTPSASPSTVGPNLTIEFNVSLGPRRKSLTAKSPLRVQAMMLLGTEFIGQDNGDGTFNALGVAGTSGLDNDELKALVTAWPGRSFPGFSVPSWEVNTATLNREKMVPVQAAWYRGIMVSFVIGRVGLRAGISGIYFWGRTNKNNPEKERHLMHRNGLTKSPFLVPPVRLLYRRAIIEESKCIFRIQDVLFLAQAEGRTISLSEAIKDLKKNLVVLRTVASFELPSSDINLLKLIPQSFTALNAHIWNPSLWYLPYEVKNIQCRSAQLLNFNELPQEPLALAGDLIVLQGFYLRELFSSSDSHGWALPMAAPSEACRQNGPSEIPARPFFAPPPLVHQPFEVNSHVGDFRDHSMSENSTACTVIPLNNKVDSDFQILQLLSTQMLKLPPIADPSTGLQMAFQWIDSGSRNSQRLTFLLSMLTGVTILFWNLPFNLSWE